MILRWGGVHGCLWRESETLLVCLELHVHNWCSHNNNVANLNVLKTNEHLKLF